MPGQARAIGAWISTQCLTNSSCDIPRFRWRSEALLIKKGPGWAPQAIFKAEADAASPAKPITVRRRVVGVTSLFEDMRRSPCRQAAQTSIWDLWTKPSGVHAK